MDEDEFYQRRQDRMRELNKPLKKASIILTVGFSLIGIAMYIVQGLNLPFSDYLVAMRVLIGALLLNFLLVLYVAER